MQFALPYGRTARTLTIPERQVAGVIAPHTPSTAAADLAAALAQPHALPPLAELCRAKRVTLFIGDKTRSTPRAAAGRALLEQLRPATAVQIFITTGSHAATAPEDRAVIDQLVAYAATLGITASGHIHDCRHDPLLACGTTPRGTAVELNARALAADVLVVHSDVKPHYFAGYSNATKHLLPGISGYPGIEQNHALALDPAAQFGHHPWHPQPSRRQNPLAEDLLDAYQLAVGNRPVFVLATISDHDCVRWAAAGAAATVMAEAFAELDRSSLQQVVPCRHAVISCGGYPLDETLYTAHAGLEMVRAAIAPGGEVLLLAECADGVAPNESAIRHFYEPLCRPLAELTAGNPATYRLGAHKTVRLAQFLSRHTLFLTSALPPETVRAIHCHPAPEPQAIVDRWLQQQASILVINHANKLALLPASPPSGQH